MTNWLNWRKKKSQDPKMNRPLLNLKSKGNQHIVSYLSDYLSIDWPKFAVMLKGPWGCGKTWFIREIIKEIEATNKKKTILYISLFGLKSTGQIDRAVLKAMYPYLDHTLKALGPVRKAKSAVSGPRDT